MNITRIKDVVNRLSSNHDGEVMAAARALCRLAASEGMLVGELFININSMSMKPRSWKDYCSALLGCKDGLSDWEINFLSDIQKRPTITPKTHNKLMEIAKKMGLEE